LIARLSTPRKLGIQSTGYAMNLAICETKPVESKLDIYWETSTSGLISELNTAIQEGSDVSIGEMSQWDFYLSEADAPGTVINSAPITFTDILSNPIEPTSVRLQSVVTGSTPGTNITNKFVVEKIPNTFSYNIKTSPNSYFYYGYNGNVNELYNFTIVVSAGSPSISKTFVNSGILSNEAPTITNTPQGIVEANLGETDIYTFEGINGSNVLGGKNTYDLTWSIGVGANPKFSIGNDGILKNTSQDGDGAYYIPIILSDAGGKTDVSSINVVYPTKNEVIFDSEIGVYGGAGTFFLSGHVTIVGADATFWSFAQVVANGSYPSEVVSDIYIGAEFGSAYQSGVGETSSSSFTLSAGTYSFQATIYVTGDTITIGGGGIGYSQ
jgi:hypothetical protein